MRKATAYRLIAVVAIIPTIAAAALWVSVLLGGPPTPAQPLALSLIVISLVLVSVALALELRQVTR